MALQLQENFYNGVAADFNMKYPGGSFRIHGTGRVSGSQSHEGYYNNVEFNYTNQQEIFVGFGWWHGNAADGNTAIFRFMDGGSNQITFGRLTVGGYTQITCYRGGTLLGTTNIPAGAVQISSWHFLEFYVKIHGSAGAVTVKVDGVARLTLTGINTLSTANLYTNRFRFDEGDRYWRITDLYICDATGTVNNTFLGDIKVGSAVPSAAGDSTQFTPSAGSNYQCVDEQSQDGDSTYVSSGTVGHIDLYNFPDVTFTGAVGAVSLTVWARKDDAGSRSIRLLVKSGGTVYNSADIALGNTYQPYQWFLDTDPATGVAWTQAGYNAAQFGFEVMT